MIERAERAQPANVSLGRGVVVALLLTVCVFAVLSIASDVRALRQSLSTFRWSALAVALGLVLGNYALRFGRWQYYLRVLSVRVEARLSALVFVAGFLMSVTPGKMGEVFKSFLLHEYRGINVARTASIVVAERLLDLVALVLLVSIAGTGFPNGWLVAGSGGLLVSGIVLVCTVRPLGHWAIGLTERVGPLARIAPKLREAYAALTDLTRAGPFLVGTAYACAGWALECVAAFCLIEGFSDARVSMAGAAFAYSGGTLVGALAMLPGGLGVAELGMSKLFQIADPQLTLATAAAATILVRLCTLWFGVGLGGLSLVILRVAEKKRALPHGEAS